MNDKEIQDLQSEYIEKLKEALKRLCEDALFIARSGVAGKMGREYLIDAVKEARKLSDLKSDYE